LKQRTTAEKIETDKKDYSFSHSFQKPYDSIFFRLTSIFTSEKEAGIIRMKVSYDQLHLALQNEEESQTHSERKDRR